MGQITANHTACCCWIENFYMVQRTNRLLRGLSMAERWLARFRRGAGRAAFDKEVPVRRPGRIIACSDCFKDHGFRLTASATGLDRRARCDNCGSSMGRKLDWPSLLAACQKFFVIGSVPTGRGIFAPVIQVNDLYGNSDQFGTPELNADIQLLADLYGIFCFYYGPPLWMLGKPPGEDGRAEWLDEDFAYIIKHCPDLSLRDGLLYRVQLNLRDAEIAPNRFCSPPPHVRKTYGRFDSKDVLICYAALDVETCIHESRVNLQDDIFVAVLQPAWPLRLLDLSECSSPSDVDRFEDPYIWLRSLLYNSDDCTYGICRQLARHIRNRGYEGFVFPSFFQQATERTHKNVALFGTPIRSGAVALTSLNKVRIQNMVYDWQFGPITVGAFGDSE